MIPDFPIDIRIRLAELPILCHVGWVSFAETSQQFRKLAKSGSNKKKFNSANLILMSIGKSGIIKFVSFLTSGFTNMAVMNPPEKKLAKRTSVHCTD